MTSPPDTSISAPGIASPSSDHLAGTPRIVAESLAPVHDPVLTALRPGPWAPVPLVANALARSVAPDEAEDRPPSWLLPEQGRSFRRTLFALRRHGGVLLADPVGTGKTYIALAAAVALARGRPTACLVPATLTEQWRATAASLGIDIAVGSHQLASRGRLPAINDGPVIVDEAHHFRNSRSRRYESVAPWLIGRPVLLVTATPVVNRLRDLLHVLLLGIRDDALAVDGVPSLRELLRHGRGSPALGRLVVESSAHGIRPARRGAVSLAGIEERASAERLLDAVDALRLSRSPATERLIRSVFRHAAASSPAALAGALRHYRGLLLHARDAAAAGQPLDRAALRRLTGELEDQLVWWELMPASPDPGELALEDLDRIGASLAAAIQEESEPDGKVSRLSRLLADNRPTIVFTARRETVRYLRDRLGPPAPAWCTGTRAGLGRCPMPRATVLGWFRERPGASPSPDVRVLLVTDVAAEGLDLQRAGRVVHYDLPWTPMRMEQREGRAVRLGSRHREVDVVTFRPPPVIERALGIARTLAAKARLPASVGLGSGGGSLWRWRSELADAFAEGPASNGTACLRAKPAGILAGVELYGSGPGPAERISATIFWIDPDGSWTDEASVVSARLAEAIRGQAAGEDPASIAALLPLVAEPVRRRLAAARGTRWRMPEADPVVRAVSRRLHQAIRVAARERAVQRLRGVERALAFVGRGHTAGEAMALAAAASAPAAQLPVRLGKLAPGAPPWAAVEPRLSGVLVFLPE